MASIRTQCVSLLVRIIAITGSLSCGPLLAQTTGLSFVKTLEPPAAAPSQMPIVALAGDTAITAYEATETRPWQIWYRNPDPSSLNGWSEPVLLAEGNADTGSDFRLSADDNVIAVGLPDAAAEAGEVHIFRTASAGAAWQLESVIPAPAMSTGFFGSKLMVRGDLLVARGGTTVHSFQFDPDTSNWSPAGWDLDFMLFQIAFATDGERIAFCSSVCTTVIRDGNGDWVGEAQTVPHTGDVLGKVQVSGEWMMINNGILHRVGAEWQRTQTLEDISYPLLVAESLLVLNFEDGGLSIWKSDGTTWTERESVGYAHDVGSIALSGDRVVADIQSFLRAADEWQPSGSVGGIRDQSEGFGAALAIDDGKIRVGIPGSDRIDLDAGELLNYQLGGSATGPIDDPLVPPGHVPYRDFADSLAVADDLLFATSKQGWHGAESILVFDGVSEALIGEIPLPAPELRAGVMVLQGDTLVVGAGATSGQPYHRGILVYERNGTGAFELAQNIPSEPEEMGVSFGSRIIQRGDWLLTGETLFRRDGPESDFVRVRQLERPDDLPLDTSLMVSDGDNLIVPPSPYSQRLAFLYHFDATNGWVLSGEVRREPPLDEDFGFCNALTIQADTAVCAYESWTDEKFELLAIRPVPGQSDWAVSETLPLDVTGVGRMTSAGAYVALVAQDGVMVFLTGEAIFDNGFE